MKFALAPKMFRNDTTYTKNYALQEVEKEYLQ